MDTTLLALVLAGVILLVGLLVRWVVVRSRRVREERAGPFLIFPMPSRPVEAVSREPAPAEAIEPPVAGPRPAPPEAAAPVESAPSPAPRPERRADREAPFVRPPRGPSHGLRVVTARGDSGGSPRSTGVAAGNLAPALQSEARPALDGTLQLLPGRLVPAAGVGQEIRFVRVPGSNEFTLGRSSGPSHTHIQLEAPTASRMHACMAFESGGWTIANLSATNPVVVNGSALPLDAALRLQDGDRLEFGEMAFTFRDR